MKTETKERKKAMKFNDAKHLLELSVLHFEGDFKDGVNYALDVFNMVHIDQEDAAIVSLPEAKKKAAKKATPVKKVTPVKKAAPNYKPKICKKCGKEFIPSSGAATMCEGCKNEKADISKAARALVNMEG